MSRGTDALIAVAGEPLAGPNNGGITPRNALEQELAELLDRANGFYAFESALHVFPSAPEPAGHSVQAWNQPELWISAYDGLADNMCFFAEDLFGAQFAIGDNQVVQFDPETGEIEAVSETLDGWAQQVLDDYEVMTGYRLAHEWQLSNGAIRPGDRLLPKRPFVLGGDFSTTNLYALDAVKGMRFRADLAIQIRDIPDGASIRFEIVD